MKSNITEGNLFEIGSLYDRFRSMKDNRKARGKRYELTMILVLIVLAKLSGEDKPSGIAEWAQIRTREYVNYWDWHASKCRSTRPVAGSWSK
jgi:hypothetical protein